MTSRRRVAVAMSGGVDSSVAAALLQAAGEDVFGLMLRLSSEQAAPANRCCAPADVTAARQVADQLGCPFYVVDAREAFEQSVISAFLSGYAQGLTPNPCIECNRSIRWGFLLETALAFGATHLATGHYARVERLDGRHVLRAGLDARKDQSYVLHVLTQSHLARAVFPLGELTKDRVRAHARELRLPVADRHESQDLCFVDGDYRAFLAARGIAPHPGPILGLEGELLGQHGGLAHYTLGQRQGLGIASRQALYVIEKDRARNALIVGRREQVGRQRFGLAHVNWIAGAPPAPAFETQVQVRYHAVRLGARVECRADARAAVELEATQPDVAPGQSAVFFDGDI
ncbi:MAG: tRNA 2-thiouridine(34) synthase MnmA, partial [Chloroflexi bacterium]|nr:tRNA 2-thiouridine(34) synthase MnmA [Chloroflexota bacterium]